MANQTITQLPDAGPITGTELVPIVQNGGTYKTTAAALAGSPVQTQTFLTKNQELTLNNSRYLETSTGLGLTDGGPTSFYRISLNGTSGSLETASGGIVVKNSASTVVSRSLATTGAGLSVSNADGTGGDPTFQLTGIAAAIANMGGTGMLAIVGGSTIAGREIRGTVNQIAVSDGNGGGDPTISIVDNVILPGTGAVKIPSGSSAEQPVGSPGLLRFNTTTNTFDGYDGSGWSSFSLGIGVESFGAGSTGLTPATQTIGPVTLGGTLVVGHGGTGANSLTGYVKGNGTSAMTAVATVPTSDLSGTISNAQLDNSSLTINGTTISLGASGTISSSTTQPLTFGTGMTPGSFDGGTAQTVALANTGVIAGSFGGASKTLTASVNAQGQLTSLSESAIAIANTQVSGLGTLSTQDANNVAITGGNINGTTIGGSTPAAGTFTSVTTTTGTVSTPPVNANDLVNKLYVDEQVAAGLNVHAAVDYEVPDSAGNLTVTYNNGAAGVGATLTNAGTLGAFTPDGIVAQVGDRILIYGQTDQTQNGVYTVTTVGDGSTPWVLTRATDADTYGGNSTTKLGQGSYFFVKSGNTGAGESYTCTTSGTIVFGTTAITFAQFSASVAYSAGTGLNLSPATTFNISNTGVVANTYGTASSVPTLAINAQGQVTSASNTAIAINANQITSGTIQNSQLANSAVTVNGTSISLGSSGTITAANPNALTINGGLTGTSYDGSTPITIALASSGVTPATYGSASQVPVFAVDTYGRVTSVTNTSIAIAAGAVSGLAASATTDTTNASNITSGTLGTARLSGSYTGISGVGTLTAGTWNANAIGVAYGGTGLTATPTNGQLPIGNGSGYTLATLTAGTNVTITNTAGGIQIDATPSFGGTVTSVDVSGGTTGLTFSGGPVTTAGTITMAGTLAVASGGTGAVTLSGYVKGNGTSAMTASTTIPNTDITGLGTMSTQNASNVAITGGAINGTTVGATTASTVRGTTVTATTQFSGPGTGLTGTASGLSIGGNAATATSATSATSATNVAGGAANQIPYNTGASATSFIAAPTLASTYLKWTGSAFAWDTASTGSVTSVAMTVPTGLTVSGSPVTSSGTLAVALQSGYSIPTTSDQSNWTTAYNDRLKWDGGSTGLNASTGRTSLGATTIGSNLFTLTNPSAITFPRFNADNTVSALNAADFRTAIGAGTSSTTGTVTSVSGTGTVSGLTLTGTVTTSGSLTLGGTLSVTPSNFASQTANTFLAAPNGTAGTPTFRAIVAADVPVLNQNTTGNAATATTLQTARTINGVSFNGSANITITANTTNTLTRGTYLTGNNFNGSAATTWEVDATSANTASKVVARDASGNFSAGTITAALDGNASTATTATNATNVATTANGTNANFFIPFVAASTTGNQALQVDAGITYNPSTNAITGGISGGTF